MLFNRALISTFLLTSAVLADRHYEHRRSRVLKQSRSDAQYSDTFASAVLVEEGIDYITASFTVPQIKGSSGSAAVVGVAMWCPDVTFFAGVELQINDGGPSYRALYQDPFQDGQFNITLLPGDEVEVMVTVDSATTGVAKIMKLSETSQQTLTSPTQLCKRNAMWAIENVGQGPMPDFGTVALRGTAISNWGFRVPQDASYIVNMGQRNHVKALTFAYGSTVSFKYW